jgi:hypothetical protein
MANLLTRIFNTSDTRTEAAPTPTPSLLSRVMDGGIMNEVRAGISTMLRSRKSLMEQLTLKAVGHARADAQLWKISVEQAEHPLRPKRQALYQRYHEVTRHDAHLMAIINDRKQEVMCQPYMVVDANGAEAVEYSQTMRSAWARDVMDYALDSVFWGHSLMQINPSVEGSGIEVTLIPREHVRPELGLVVVNPNDEVGVQYVGRRLANNLIEVGRRRDLGLLKQASLRAIQKKNALQVWEDWTEVFGLPLRIVKTNTMDDKMVEKIEQSMEQMTTGFWAIIGLNDQIELKEPNRPDAYQVYDKFIQRMTDEMSKLILGQTMTVDSGSSRAQAQVHRKVLETIIEADKLLIEHVINDQLFPLLGWTGYRFRWRKYEAITMKELSEVILNLRKAGFTPTADYLQSAFGIDKLQVVEAATAP